MSRYGMLMCGANFRMMFGEKDCKKCDKLDDENHRLNECLLYCNVNWVDSNEKVIFGDVYSSNVRTLKEILKQIMKLWTLTCIRK